MLVLVYATIFMVLTGHLPHLSLIAGKNS